MLKWTEPTRSAEFVQAGDMCESQAGMVGRVLLVQPHSGAPIAKVEWENGHTGRAMVTTLRRVVKHFHDAEWRPVGQRVRFRLSQRAEFILSLDDSVLVSQSFPTYVRINSQTVEACIEDARVILSDLFERADADPNGFCEPASNRRTCARAARALHSTLADLNLLSK